MGLPLAAFLLGLASGVHCVGMCGGIVAAFTSVVRARQTWAKRSGEGRFACSCEAGDGSNLPGLRLLEPCYS